MPSLRVLLAVALLAPLAAAPAFAQKSAQDTARQRAKQLEQQQEAERKRALEKRFPVGTSWVLTELGGKRPPAGIEATLRVDSTFRASGMAGCNTFSSNMYPGRGQTLLGSPPAITRRSCPAPVMAFERAYLQGLFSRPQWDQVGDVLTLKSRVGVLRFRRGF